MFRACASDENEQHNITSQPIKIMYYILYSSYNDDHVFSESWHEWQEDTKAETMIVCLLCDEAVHNVNELQEHIKVTPIYCLLSPQDLSISGCS